MRLSYHSVACVLWLISVHSLQNAWCVGDTHSFTVVNHLTGLANMLRRTIGVGHRSYNGMTLNFAKAICETSHTDDDISIVDLDTMADDHCIKENSVKLLICLLQVQLARQFNECQYIINASPKSLPAGLCAIHITSFAALMKWAVRSFGRHSTCYKYGESFRFAALYRIGWRLIGSCTLNNRHRRSTFSFVPRNDTEDSNTDRHIHSLTRQSLARIPLVLAAGITEEGYNINLSSVCWEAELRHAEWLYLLPGVWDVDEPCVKTLQTILVAAIETSLDFWMAGANPTFIHAKNTIISKLDIASVLKENKDRLLQLAVYPAFLRFLREAEKRQQPNGNTTISVSCKGLQGSKSTSQDTAVQLLRLVCINELYHYNFSSGGMAACVFFSHLLPYFVRYVI